MFEARYTQVICAECDEVFTREEFPGDAALYSGDPEWDMCDGCVAAEEAELLQSRYAEFEWLFEIEDR